MPQILIGPGVLFWAEVPEFPAPGEIVVLEGTGVERGLYELREAPQRFRWNSVLYPSYSRRRLGREPAKERAIRVEVLYP